MTNIIRSHESAPGGYMVTIEITGAYKNGKSRFDQIFVPLELVAGKTPAQIRQAVWDIVEDDPIRQIAGEAISAPEVTSDILEDRMIKRYEAWRRWKLTREEAEARSVAGAVINALTNKEDAAWAAYVAVIQQWRLSLNS